MSADINTQQNRYLRTVMRGFFHLLLMLVLLFLLAGRITYWQGWVFAGLAIIRLAIGAILFVRKPDLVEERVRPGPGTKWWDKVFYAFYVPLMFAIVIVGSLDVGRFGWSMPLPLYIYVLGCIAYILAHSITLWAMWVNRFFSSTVRIQMDRAQEVVQGGPYRFVRHPGYVGGILLATSMALVLGSWWALIPAGIIAVLLVIRTYLEDTTLQKELSGYADYIQKTRWRLLPGIW